MHVTEQATNNNGSSVEPIDSHLASNYLRLLGLCLRATSLQVSRNLGPIGFLSMHLAAAHPWTKATFPP